MIPRSTANDPLVLRFFAAKNGSDYYTGHVANWLDEYLEKILTKIEGFDTNKEAEDFRKVFDLIATALGEPAFCKFKEDRPTGGLAPAHYEAIAIAFANKFEAASNADVSKLRAAITAARQSAAFRENVGPGANNRTKLRGRIATIEEAIEIAAK
jgi:hypothetical protein